MELQFRIPRASKALTGSILDSGCALLMVVNLLPCLSEQWSLWVLPTINPMPSKPRHTAQRLRYPLIKKYSLNLLRDPTITYGIFLNSGMLECLRTLNRRLLAAFFQPVPGRGRPSLARTSPAGSSGPCFLLICFWQLKNQMPITLNPNHQNLNARP